MVNFGSVRGRFRRTRNCVEVPAHLFQPRRVATRSFRKPRGTEMTDEQRLSLAVGWEHAVLGCLLESPELWKEADGLSADDFALHYDRRIFRAIADLNEHSSPADIVS